MVEAGELEAGENYEEEEGDEEEEEVDINMEDEESEEEEVSEILKEEEMVDEVIDPISLMITTVAGLLGAAGGASAIMSKLEKRAETDAKAKKVYDFLTNLGGQAAKSGDKTVKEMEDQIEELASTLSEVKLLNAKLLTKSKGIGSF